MSSPTRQWSLRVQDQKRRGVLYPNTRFEGGAIYGGAGRDAGAGAAVGATVGLLQAALSGGGESTQIYRNFVAACLSDRGYRVIGWE